MVSIKLTFIYPETISTDSSKLGSFLYKEGEFNNIFLAKDT